MEPKKGAIFGSVRNVLICYKLAPSLAGAGLCLLQSELASDSRQL
jgi:hypothetical protein